MEYIGSMTGQKFLDMIEDAAEIAVSATVPKFSYAYTIKMNEPLISLGMSDAFIASLADFTRLGRSPVGNIYIGEVLHKTFISVNERGT